ncbi:MAG: hypothetical protein Q7S40_14285 [Opitutaceae bacterium]|nr:hypothetical protein [Opitutaceae bacterium]
MKLAPLSCVVACLVFACLAGVGCESVADATSGVRARLASRDESRARTFSADQRATYDAVKAAAHQMGYRFVRGGAAQGELEAVSGVGQGDTARSARQLSMKVRLQPNLEGGTQVSVRFTEIIEADSSNRAGHATETPLRDTPQYEVFFRAVERGLAGGDKE